MKKLYLLLFSVCMTCSIFAQESKMPGNKPKAIIYPGSGHINVESLKDNIDYSMDISKLSVAELRLLYNAFFARQGYIFTDGDLRSIFGQTSWYERLATKRALYPDSVTQIHFFGEEGDFMNKLKKREKELLKQNYQPLSNGIVNTNNVVNAFQLEAFNDPLKSALTKNGFAILPKDNIQLFHIYENNDYHDFPSFVTTDMYLQLFHTYFDSSLRDLEIDKFIPLLTSFSKMMHDAMVVQAKSSNKFIKDAAEWNAAYFAIGYSLLSGKPMLSVPSSYRNMAIQEMKNIMACQDKFSDFLDYHDAYFMYSLFCPRGHYSRTVTLQRYFKAMMWYQSAPFCLDNVKQLRRAIFQSAVLDGNAPLLSLYKSITEPITYLIGKNDNISVSSLYEVMKKGKYSLTSLMKNENVLRKYHDEVEAIAKSQVRILPKEAISCKYKINLMPQRYMSDNEVLLNMVDDKSQPVTKRDNPKGLDVFAALGSNTAEKILLGELQEGELWNEYTSRLTEMKAKMQSVDSHATISNRWIESLCSMLGTDSRYPYFMKTPQWDKKNLNAALASWTELKHDAILYAKQPMPAECGGGGELPDPVVVGYVEPNVAYWEKAIGLLDATSSILKRFNLFTNVVSKHTKSLREMAEFLLHASNKELQGETLTKEEFKNIEIIGSSFELLTLDLLKRPNQYLNSWDNVQGADKSVAVVADVFTSNASNNPNKSILYEAVGNVDEIYVVVEINGYLYLTRGAVLSYREFKEPLDDIRLTDEEWQKQLQTKPEKGVPSWMKEILLPANSVSNDNEKVFYSSGC